MGGGGSPGTGQGGSIVGSCSDGILKDWEDPPEAEGQGTPVLEEHEQEQILQIVAQQIEKAIGQGKGSAYADWAGQILRPRVDPKQLLIASVRKAIEKTSGGHDDTSYRRPSRRQSVGNVIRPGRVAIVPRICLIIDSSGSMDQRDLGLAVGMVANVLNGFRLRDGVKVLVGDTCAQTCEQVFDPKKIEIAGRGGTDMAALIEHAASEVEPKPQLIVLITDGWTDYPQQPVGIPLVVCLTHDKAKDCYPVPAWAKSIVLA